MDRGVGGFQGFGGLGFMDTGVPEVCGSYKASILTHQNLLFGRVLINSDL